MTDQTPLIKLTGMYENVSKTGQVYFVGVAGGIKLILLKNTRAAKNEPGWNLCIAPRSGKQTAAQLQNAPQQVAKQSPATPTLWRKTTNPVDPELNDALADLLA